jgi:uncharacterized protein YacL
MLLYFIRALFFITAASVLLVGLNATGRTEQDIMVFVVGLAISILAIAVEWLTPKKSLTALAGVFFGLLVGMAINSWAMKPIIEMLNVVYNLQIPEPTLRMIIWMSGMCICYLIISIVIRTKDDVRFVIPYVEFSRQIKGLRPLVLDTSVIIDGRIADIAETRFFDSPLIVPRFVLNELQLIADSADKMKRNRGRRGLDMLNKLQHTTAVEVIVDDTPPPGIEEKAGVDQKLVAFSKQCNGRLVTNDYNLNKVAQLRGVDVVNINDLANSIKTITLPGETMQVKIMRPGEESTQGVGYLEDGTMVVVEGANDRIGQPIHFTVTSALQTSAGRMIFGKMEESGPSSGSSDNGTRNRGYQPNRGPRKY